MRAAVFWDAQRSPLMSATSTSAPPRPGEVEVDIVAAGVCHSDLHMVKGEWKHRAPVVLGHEGSGVVTAVGPGVQGLTAGDHVVLSWVPDCGSCGTASAGKPAQCSTSAQVIGRDGTMFDGTLALVDRRAGVLSLLGSLVVCRACGSTRLGCDQGSQGRCHSTWSPLWVARWQPVSVQSEHRCRCRKAPPWQ